MFTISSNRINLNFEPNNFIFGDMKVQSWHFVQNYTQKFSLFLSPLANHILRNKCLRTNISIKSNNFLQFLRN
jgi:hypothetical protein